MKANIKRSILCSARTTITVLMTVSGSLLISGISQAAAAADAQVREDASKPADSPGAPKVPTSTAPVHSKGEGIAVHGWWTIDVHNPDGSLDRHLEFENALCKGFTDNVVPTLSVPGGDSTLVSLMQTAAGQGGASSGIWSIVLGQPEPPQLMPGPPPLVVAAPNCATTYDFVLSSAPAAYVPQNYPGIPIALNCSGTQCFSTLSAQGTSTTGGAGITLSGQFTVPSPLPSGAASLTISAVGTDLFTCTPGGSAILGQANCSTLTSAIFSGAASNAPCVIIPQVTGSNVTTTAGGVEVICPGPANSWTAGHTIVDVYASTYPVAGQPGRAPFSGVVLGTAGNPAPLVVVPGQVVSITWALSFQ